MKAESNLVEHVIPQGYRVAGVHCGIKRNPAKEDIALVVSEQNASAAGVYTTNRFCAAPVLIDRERTPSESVRAVVVNSGNANACTGREGIEDANQMTAWTASLCGIVPEQALVLSTGIIGERLPMEKIDAGIRAAHERLGTSADDLVGAARGFMTTDSHHKLASRLLEHLTPGASLLGFAKGAAMIGPRMATMLSLLVTDLAVSATDSQRILSRVVDRTFNCISVEGHTSTNDTVLLLANGAAGGETLRGSQLDQFEAAVEDVCVELARAIPSDGEGATHLITIKVTGCDTDDDAKRVAKAVADSPLVKTAVTGADPNWGRVISAVGYAGVPFDAEQVRLHINGLCLFDAGAPVAFDPAAVSDSIRASFETEIDLSVGRGSGSARHWTCDLSSEYVRLNADYHT